MERLPTELYDLVRPAQKLLPSHPVLILFYTQIVLYNVNPHPERWPKFIETNADVFFRECCTPGRRPDKFRLLEDRLSLATLRLVNRAFCRSASRLLFRQLVLSDELSFTRLEELSQYAPLVREIFCTFDCWSGEQIVWEPCRVDWLIHLDTCAQNLLSRFAGFPNLRAIKYQMDCHLLGDPGIAEVRAVTIVDSPRDRQLTELEICVTPLEDIDPIFSDQVEGGWMAMKNRLQHLRHLDIAIDGRLQYHQHLWIWGTDR